MGDGKVYLIGVPEDDKYKIGYTKREISKRVNEVKTGNPKKVEVIKLFETEHYAKVETWMHNKHASKRKEGEWFELTMEDVNNFYDDCQKGHNIFQMLIKSGNPFI